MSFFWSRDVGSRMAPQNTSGENVFIAELTYDGVIKKLHNRGEGHSLTAKTN